MVASQRIRLYQLCHGYHISDIDMISLNKASNTCLVLDDSRSDSSREAELVVCLGPGANSRICEELSDTELLAKCIVGYALGIDLTKRDVQAKAKSMRRPWEESKAFDHSALIGPIYPMVGALPWDRALLCLKTNGEVRQQSTLDKMIWPVVDIIKYIAERNEIAPGDMIYTGTPAGVGQLKIGDLCEVELVDKDEANTPIIAGIECSMRLTQSLQ
ncbi:hypothetical protein FOL47_006795 [Perkinsus chesapeaki]|uniref:Fumarylacetoacetase-like C-terminal domain-containing protein n=1 Tax=Perkinsus chesapeaki TaxID=330153 RepID=A0A7J6LPY2_PERCH|nr:hypothetical protein FOL47_006795 [Perkinsus chesapeaki]